MNWEEYFEKGEHKEINDNLVIIKKVKDKGFYSLTIMFWCCVFGFIIMLISMAFGITEQNTIKRDLNEKSAYNINYINEDRNDAKKGVKIAYTGIYDVKLMAEAIMNYETGWFKSNAWLTKNNACGIMTWQSGKRELKKFNSQKEGKEACYKLVQKYFDRGQNTPEKMQPNYAPNGEKGNEHWVRSVKIIYGKLGEK